MSVPFYYEKFLRFFFIIFFKLIILGTKLIHINLEFIADYVAYIFLFLPFYAVSNQEPFHHLIVFLCSMLGK